MPHNYTADMPQMCKLSIPIDKLELSELIEREIEEENRILHLSNHLLQCHM